MKQLYYYLDKTNGFIEKLCFLAMLFLFSLQANAQCPTGDVRLSSQYEVDNFRDMYPNCTAVSGSLVIYGFEMTDISPLKKIKTVSEDVVVSNSMYLTNLDDLSGITNIGGNLSIVYNDELKDISGLSKISTVENLTIEHNYKLNSLDDLSALEIINGHFSLYKNPELKNIDGLSALTSIKGGLTLRENFLLKNLDGLKHLKDIGSHIYIWQNYELEDLNGLSALTAMNGRLDLYDNSKLKDISGLKNIASNITYLSIGGHPLLSVCNIEPVCKMVKYSNSNSVFISGNGVGCNSNDTVLRICYPCNEPANIKASGITNNTATIEWEGTGNFDIIWGEEDFYVWAGEGTMQEGVSGNSFQLTGLAESTTYDVYIYQNCGTHESDYIKYTFTTNAQCPNGDVDIANQADVENYYAMYPDCTKINGTLYIAGVTITDISAFSKLNTINGDLLVNATSLTNLDALSSISSIDGELSIYKNAELTDISGVKNISGITELYIERNYILSVCNIASVCNFLQGSGVRYIENNATGCESVDVVKAACISTCVVPTNLTSSNITYNKAIVSWTNSGTFDIEWGEEGFAEGTGTRQSGIAASSYTITGLAESSSYDVYVRQNCTDTQSSWVKHTFSTISTCPSGNIVLSSQEDVDYFAAMYPNCTKIEGSLNIKENVSSLSPLINLQSIGTNLSISGTQLTNLEGLSSVTTINNELEISFNSKLTDISSLKNLNAETLNYLFIVDNRKLSNCNIASVCSYLQGSGSRFIEYNATNCESVEDVKDACTSVLSTSDINKKGIVVYPNPFTDVINLSDIKNIESINVNDVSGKLIKTIKPAKEINFSNNASGTYIINIKFKDGDTKSFKVIKK